jgi:hypothetical protein
MARNVMPKRLPKSKAPTVKISIELTHVEIMEFGEIMTIVYTSARKGKNPPEYIERFVGLLVDAASVTGFDKLRAAGHR